MGGGGNASCPCTGVPQRTAAGSAGRLTARRGAITLPAQRGAGHCQHLREWATAPMPLQAAECVPCSHPHQGQRDLPDRALLSLSTHPATPYYDLEPPQPPCNQHELSPQNKTVGIVGAGRIGAAYARMMVEGHKMNLVYYDPYPNKQLEEYIRYGRERRGTVRQGGLGWELAAWMRAGAGTQAWCYGTGCGTCAQNRRGVAGIPLDWVCSSEPHSGRG